MFVAIETQDIAGTISEAYAPGGDHIEKWLNVAGSGIENCVHDQVHALTSDSPVSFFRVEEVGNFVGYFGTQHEGSFLSTIFIVPEYRPRKKEFWALIEAKTQPVFRNGGFKKNEPACNFYRKMGGKEVASFVAPAGPVIMFEFRKDGSWL